LLDPKGALKSDTNIELLENTLIDYHPQDPNADSRKLLQIEFKETLDKAYISEHKT
jgi:hypothetical protein